MRAGRRIGVIIPALDEERAIGKVLADIPDWVDQIVVADNGSRDRTAELAASHGAVIAREDERGYGAACLAGLKQLDPVDIIVFVDGDYSDFPDEMDRLVDPIIAGDQDFVIGSRVRGDLMPGALTPQQRFGNWLACRLVRLFWGVQFTDLGPFRAISSQALGELQMGDRNFGWTIEMQIKAVERGLLVLEVPVRYRPRIGVSKVSGTLKGSVLAGVKILAIIGSSAWRSGIAAATGKR